MTFKSAGDLGDVLWQMPAMRALGGGTLCLHAEKWTREPMTEAKVQSLRALLSTQEYVKEVRWLVPGEAVDVNLNDFRAEYFRPDSMGKRGWEGLFRERNLCEWILRTHGVDPVEQNWPWLDVVPKRNALVIINRTARYQNGKFPWRKVVEKYKGDIAFVGTPNEWTDFGHTVQNLIPYLETPTLLDLSQVIAGADLFIGNQSCAYAIAEGLKRPAVLEVCPWMPNCLFSRHDCVHGWDEKVELPDL